MSNKYWIWWCRYNEKYSIEMVQAKNRHRRNQASRKDKSFKHLNGLLIKLKIVFPWSQNGLP